MGRRRKWRWKEVMAYSSCMCLAQKGDQWQVIADEEDIDEIEVDVEEDEEPRRGGISFDKTDQNAQYVRMLADVKVRTKPELSHEPKVLRDRRRSSILQDSDLEILKNLEQNLYKTKKGLEFSTLHRVRRKRPVLIFSKENASVLDEHYVGQAKCLLSTIGDWEFNIFNLDKLTNGRALFHVSLQLFQEHNLIETFKLDIVKLMRCISLIEEGYHNSNPYHNAVHAADVTQAMHCYLKEHKLSGSLTPLETMIALLSAIVHDLDHPGVNQAFLVATSNHLAQLYNNQSVLENHHWRSAIGVMRESGVFDHFDNITWSSIESQLKSLILATDITRQGEFMSQLRGYLDRGDLDLSQHEHKHFILQIALKCADISNPCRPWQSSKKWSESVCDEFFKQGDCESRLRLPVGPLCDRHNTTVATIQSKFMEFVVLPLFNEWHRFNPTQLSRVMVGNIKSNKGNWDEIEKMHEAAKAKEEQSRQVLQEESEEDSVADDAEVSSEKEEPQSETPHSPMSVENAEILDVVDADVENCDKENHAPPSESSDNAEEAADTLDYDNPTFDMRLSRRHSLPVHTEVKDTAFLLNHRKESVPMFSRRHSLPTSQVQNATSFGLLAQKLAVLAEKSSTNGNRSIDFDILRPKITSLSRSLDADAISKASIEANKLTSAHGLDVFDTTLLAQRRQFTSEPQVTDNIAQAVTESQDSNQTAKTFHNSQLNSSSSAKQRNNKGTVLRPVNSILPPIESSPVERSPPVDNAAMYHKSSERLLGSTSSPDESGGFYEDQDLTSPISQTSSLSSEQVPLLDNCIVRKPRTCSFETESPEC